MAQLDLQIEYRRRIGLIYGPSGCGKTSLVRAGVLPSLPERIKVIYIEASAHDTESRLLRALESLYPSVAGLSLVDALSHIRRQGLGNERPPKLLIVIDQFEQWLHAIDDPATAELTSALRQCDGQAIQSIVMVRDDFWLSVTRFLQELDVAITVAKTVTWLISSKCRMLYRSWGCLA